jgi:hypothetical protein
MDSVRYYQIWMWNRIEKNNENWILMYPLYCYIKFEYRYGYVKRIRISNISNIRVHIPIPTRKFKKVRQN